MEKVFGGVNIVNKRHEIKNLLVNPFPVYFLIGIACKINLIRYFFINLKSSFALVGYAFIPIMIIVIVAWDVSGFRYYKKWKTLRNNGDIITAKELVINTLGHFFVILLGIIVSSLLIPVF